MKLMDSARLDHAVPSFLPMYGKDCSSAAASSKSSSRIELGY